MPSGYFWCGCGRLAVAAVLDREGLVAAGADQDKSDEGDGRGDGLADPEPEEVPGLDEAGAAREVSKQNYPDDHFNNEDPADDVGGNFAIVFFHGKSSYNLSINL